MKSVDNPLTEARPPEVPLSAAPLIRVLVQIRFPVVASVDKQEFIGPFQEAIRKEYGILRREQSVGFVLGSAGPIPAPQSTIWRFKNETGTWRASLAPDFVALETTKYESQAELISRLKELLLATQEHIRPSVVDRIGVRYIDQIRDANAKDMRRLIRPEVAGVLNAAWASDAVQVLSENLFEVPPGTSRILARWGMIPPQATIDPAVMEPVDQRSWILDLDMFDARSQPFEAESLTAVAESFAARLYTVFRWAVTEEFLCRFGGQPK